MNPFHRIRGRERKGPGKHLVEGDTQRVEVATGIDRPVHAAGLLGRHVSKRSGNDLRWRGCLALAWQPRRYAKTREPDVARGIDQQMRGLDVLVDKPTLMDLAQRRCQGDRDLQETGQLKRSSPNSI